MSSLRRRQEVLSKLSLSSTVEEVGQAAKDCGFAVLATRLMVNGVDAECILNNVDSISRLKDVEGGGPPYSFRHRALLFKYFIGPLRAHLQACRKREADAEVARLAAFLMVTKAEARMILKEKCSGPGSGVKIKQERD